MRRRRERYATGLSTEKFMIISAFILMLGSAAVCLASLRSMRGDAIGLPLVAIGTFIFLYAVQPLMLLESGDAGAFLTKRQFAWAMIVPAVMLPCFVWGWNRERPRFRLKRRAPWNPVALWNFGFVTAVIGLSFYIVFLHRSGGIVHAFSKAHGEAMAWQGNSAYLYGGMWWVVSGEAMMMFASSRFKVGGWRRAAFILLIAAYLADGLLTSSRGALFSGCAAIFAGLSISRRKLPSLRQAFALLTVLGFGALMMVGYRGVLHLGNNGQQAPSFWKALDASSAVGATSVAHDTTGMEFVVSGAILSTVDQMQKYDLGLRWIYFLALNPIPRLLWPGKHYPKSPGITNVDIRELTGLRTDSGFAPGIVGNVYVEFGLGEAIFFYWFGRLSRRLFAAAWLFQSLISFCAYVMLYALSLNIFAQGFNTLFVGFGYSMIPVVLYALVSRVGRRQATAFAGRPEFPGLPEKGHVQCSS